MKDKNNNANSSRYSILKEKMIQKLSSFKDKTKNLIRTNFELGLFHLYKHNINDTIFRLRLVLFFNKNHVLAQYYLAICQYIKNNSKDAQKILETLHNTNPSFKPAKHMLDFLYDLTVPEYINSELIKNFFNSLIDEEYYFTDMAPIYQTITNLVTSHLTDNEKKVNVLDIGCGSGLCFEYIKNNIKTNKSFGIDFSEKSIDVVKKQKLYTSALCQDFQTFIDETKEHFDLIIADSVLHYYKNFSTQLENLNNTLTKDGLIVFTIDKSLKNTPVTFNHTLTNLAFNKEHIKKTISKTNLKLLKIESKTLQNKNLYICLCTKKS